MKQVRIGCLFIFFLCTISFGQENGSSDIFTKFKTEKAKITAMAFDFREKVLVKATGEEETILGSIKFMAPDRIYIEYVLPYRQVIVCNGKKVWYYLPEYNQVSVHTVDRFADLTGQHFPFLSWISDDSAWARWSRETARETKGYRLTFVSEDREQQAILFLSRDDWLPYRLELNDSYQSLSIQLENVVKNPEIDPRTFVFKIPEGTQVFESP